MPRENEQGISPSLRITDPGLWYMGGTIGHSRYFSRHVALQIKTDLMGTPLPIYQGERRPEKENY